VGQLSINAVYCVGLYVIAERRIEKVYENERGDPE
jgi:hypothetical protein